MKNDYLITNNILNTVYEFSKLQTRLYSAEIPKIWEDTLKKEADFRSALSAVSIDSKYSQRAITSHLSNHKTPIDLKSDFENYINLKTKIIRLLKSEHIDIKMLDKIHSEVIGKPYAEGRKFRDKVKTISKFISDKESIQTVDLKIKTRPSDISRKLNELFTWIENQKDPLNPIVLAAITYVRFLRIHPYVDGNGRTATMLVHGLLYQNQIDKHNLLPFEEYFFRNRLRYYQVLEQTIETDNLTVWLEFFTMSLLFSIEKSISILKKISGGSMDLINNRIVETTENEQSIVLYFYKHGPSSGSRVAEKMGVSRQYVHTILKSLKDKNIVEKIDNYRYDLKNSD